MESCADRARHHQVHPADREVDVRSEVRGLDNVPPGTSLVVCNHSGGLVSFDLCVGTGYYDKYG